MTAKVIAQLGATLGRQFSYALLQAVAQLNDRTLHEELHRLVEAEIVYQRGVPPQATYTFKHALIQDAAYQSLLRSTRQQYHQRIAQVLTERFPDTAETQPELLAHHYTEAGLTEQAIAYWQRAGQHASDRSAYLEAISHLTTGIELLKTLPETPEHTQQALTLYIGLGAALLVTKGHAAPEVAQAFTQARALCQQVGEPSQLAPSPVGSAAVLSGPAPVPHGARDWRHVAAPGTAHRRPRAGGPRPLYPCVFVVVAWRGVGGPPTPGGRHRPLHARAAPCAVRSAWAKIWGCPAASMPRGPSGCWGIRRKPWPTSTRP